VHDEIVLIDQVPREFVERVGSPVADMAVRGGDSFYGTATAFRAALFRR
jgi:hypothetical protein